MSTTLETHDGSCRYYRVEVKGSKTIVTYGKLGSAGQTHEETHASAAEASTHAENLVAKQLYKGYERTAKRKREVDEGPRKSARVALARIVKAKATPKASATKKGTGKVTKKATTAKKTTTKKSTKKAHAPARMTVAPRMTAAPRMTVTPKKTATPKKSPATKKATSKKATNSKKAATSKNSPAPKKAPTPKKAPIPKLAPNPKKVSAPKAAQKTSIPIEWQVKLAATGYGVYVDDTHAYSGDESGLVQQFDKAGALQKQYRLPAGVKCIVGDGIFLYVGTNKGELYDITSGVPRLMSKIEEFAEVYWMDVRNGLIAASDEKGKVALVNAEGETIWVHQEKGDSGWMCFIDDTGVSGVHKRELKKGDKLWDSHGEIKDVMFGQQDVDYVYCTVINNKSFKLDKKTGGIVHTFPNGGPSIGVSKDSKRILCEDKLTLFSADGNILHQLAFERYDYPVSLATWSDFEFYGVNEFLTKYDFSPESLAKVKAGKWKSQSFVAESREEIMPETSIDSTSDTSSGVLCECVKEGGKLRVRVLSPGYNSSWNVQFPRAIREDGAKYVVEKIVDQSGFYRAWGDIKKVQN